MKNLTLHQQTHRLGQFILANPWTAMLVSDGRKPENQEETYLDPGSTCQNTTQTLI